LTIMTDNHPAQIDDRTLVEQAMPHPDYVLTEQLILPVPAADAFEAVRTVDLTDIRQPAVRAALWARALPQRLHRRIPPRQPTRLTLADLASEGDWILLGQRPVSDIALGAVGRFWTPVVQWRPVTAEEFTADAEPGWAKIAMGFVVLPYGGHRSVVAHEVRITCYDDDTRKAFERYWWTVRPFVRLVSRDMLRTIREAATNAVRSPAVDEPPP
jgi:hypothetical protein